MKKIIAFCVAMMVAAHIFASGKIYYENGMKIMHSTFKLTEKDFAKTDFFTKNIPNRYYEDLNVQIFKILCRNLKDGELHKELGIHALKKKQGTSIVFNEDTNTIQCALYDKKKKGFMVYSFFLDIDDELKKAYGENLARYDTCIKGIEWCNWVIENCSSPTVQKSRTVQVPYTYQDKVWIAGLPGAQNDTMGSIPSTSGHWETQTYTAYRDEIQYYTDTNPNYDPAKVAEAQKNLPLWQREKTAIEEKLRYLPLRITPIKNSSE